MKTYETVKLEIVDFLEDWIRTSGEAGGEAKGVYEHVSELDPATKEDWF